MSTASTPSKRRILLLCLLGYTVAYLLRTNLSAVLDKLIVEMHISRAMAGAMGSLFLWMYAAGQIGAGYLAERVNPKRMVSVGVLLAALCNVGVGICHSYGPMLSLWGLNGLLVGLIWSPTFKILTNWFDAREYQRVSVWISLPTTMGYLISWGMIRALVIRLPWQVAFFLPGALALLFLIAWELWLVPMPRDAESSDALALQGEQDQDPQKHHRMPFGRLLVGMGLLFVGIAAVAQGLIKEGLNLWGPTLLSEIGGQMAEGLVAGFSIIIPLCGTLGLLAVGWMMKRMGDSGPRVLLLFGAAALASVGIYLMQGQFLATVSLLGLLMACVCGANMLITVTIPMGFVKHRIAAQVSGALNFLCYAGAGLGGGTFGLISERWGWQSVYLMWALLCGVALTALWLWMWLRRERLSSSFPR